jgi:signal transduction histidine kinase/DNA-binding response OmpR family regulator
MDWIELGNNPRLNLSNLRAGTHKLFIRGGDDKGNWSKNNIELIIVQKAFFYEQVWFYVVLICLLITSLLLIIKLLKTKIAKATAQLENDKNLIKQQAETLKKLDKAKSDFFTNITHEFRTPLTIIQGITNHVKSKSDSYNIKAINDIEDNSKQLLEMVNQILDLKKLESSEMKLKPVLADVVIFMDYIIDSYKYVAEQNGLKLSFKTDEEKLLMDYDPEKLKIVLTNLISNAIKFTPDDGTINVLLFKDSTSENLNISINDTGLGFKETDEKAVFTRFYQSDNNAFIEKKGSGLGLNYVQELLKLMKGTIQIDSKIYTGTNVVVTLPITQNETYKALEPEKKLAAVLNNGFKQNEFKDTQLKKNAYTILVVEDNSSIRSLLQQQFNSYNILTAKEGEEGINKALNEVPDLIISDVMMPNKSGYELTEILKENKITSHIPIILLTAKADQTSKIEGLKAKADAYIYKPYDTVELGLTVENLIEGRQTLQDIYKNLNAGSPPTTQPKEDVFIMNLRQVIEENMSANNFDVHYLCKSMNIGRAQLHNKVSALTGLSTTNYINHIRLLKAQELIKNSNLNFSEISNAIGFSSLSYFSKKFKEEFGLSPKQYSESYVQNKN